VAKVQMTITISEQGQLNVNGPIHDKLLCFGLLELAKEAVPEHHRKKANGSGIMLAGAPVNAVLGRGDN
jgi:hypothetical protein